MKNTQDSVKAEVDGGSPPAAVSAGTNKGTVRVLQALSLFTRQPAWGVTEVSRALGCSKNSAFQALDTLVKEALVVRDPSGQRYQLSHGVIDFVGDGEALDVRALCQPYLSRLQRLTGASTFLSIIVGRYSVCIDSMQALGVTVGYSPLSQPVPLHAGTSSRLLLACLDDEEIDRFICLAGSRQAFTPTTITEAGALWEEVRRIRVLGYSRSYEDFSTGATYLAFPVRGAMDRPLAAITIGGPIDRFTREVADGFVPAIRAVMAELNQHSRLFPATPIIRF